MRIILFSLLLSIVFVSLVGDSFAQSDLKRSTSIFVQTVVRNSDGQMVAYLEANKVFVPNSDLLNIFLDTQSPQQTFVNTGKSYDLIHLEFPQEYNNHYVISKTAFGFVAEGKEIMMAYSDHDGIPIVSGDTLTSIWTIIRPSH